MRACRVTRWFPRGSSKALTWKSSLSASPAGRHTCSKNRSFWRPLIPHSPIQLVPQAVFPLGVEDVPVGWHFKKILFLKLCFTIKSSKFVFCKMTYLQHCIYTCVYTDVYIKNGLVLVCNQGLEKFHPLLLKPPLPLCPPCPCYYQTLATTDWFSVPTVLVPSGHHRYGMEQKWLFCLAPFPWCNVLKINSCYFPFQNCMPFHRTSRLQGSQCEAIKTFQHGYM